MNDKANWPDDYECAGQITLEAYIKSKEKNSGWISTCERHPEKNGSYLVTIAESDGTAEIRFITVDHANSDGTWLHYPERISKNKFQKVIAWMELPEIYQGQ